MNRSILIVICDFLVLSAMSLSMGLAKPSPAGTGTTESFRPVTHEFLLEQLEKAVQNRQDTLGENARLNDAMEETNQLLEALKKDMAEKAERIARMESQLSAAQDDTARRDAELFAQRKKASELADSLARAEAMLGNMKKSMDEKSKELQGTQLTLAERNAALKYAQKALEEKTSELKQSAAELSDKNAELARVLRIAEEKEAALAVTKKRAAEKEAALFQAELLAMERKTELERAKTESLILTEKLADSSRDLKKEQESRSFMEGQLSRANDEIDELKRQAGTREIRLKEAETALHANRRLVDDLKTKMAEELLKQAKLRGELTETSSKLRVQESRTQQAEQTEKETRARLVAKEEVLRKTESDLARTSAMLRSDALSSYATAVRTLHMKLKNDRLFRDFTVDEKYFLPEIRWNGKVFLIGAVENVTGLLSRQTGYTRVAELSYTVAPAGKKLTFPPVSVTDPILSLAEDPRICLLAMDDRMTVASVPLNVMTADALRKRGLQNLTLFKSSRYGEGSAQLDGRCSMRPDTDDFLLIRNSLRSSSEVPAQVGDFVISREGQFVGVVVRVSANAAEGRADAWCRILPGQTDFSRAVRIPVVRKSGEEWYASFVSSLTDLHKKIVQMNRQPMD